MNGIQISKAFWREQVKESLRSTFPEAFDGFAVGLCGHGSECLGFDDELSRDHDWGPGMFVFLRPEDFNRIGPQVHKVLVSLPDTYEGYRVHKPRKLSRGSRAGVFTFEEWLRRKCGITSDFSNVLDWLVVEDFVMRRATNGEIWHDPSDVVTGRRIQLSYYPEDVWRKKLAVCCHMLQAHGPYNTARALQRNDELTAGMSAHLFLKRAMQMCHLLNKEYAPYFKWVFRSVLRQDWSPEFIHDLSVLGSDQGIETKLNSIDRIVHVFRSRLNSMIPEIAACTQTGPMNRFIDIARVINSTIEDEALREHNYVNQAGAFDG
jgi:hypothetical protein